MTVFGCQSQFGVFLLPFNDQCSHHIETSQLICSANQLTGFYMMGALVYKVLNAHWFFSDFVNDGN